MGKLNARKAVLMVMDRKSKELENYDAGSEEFLTGTKGINQLAESAQKMKQVDWMEVARLGTTVVLTAVTIVASETRILDTKPVQWIKGLVMRH